jgi:hypothetical protein
MEDINPRIMEKIWHSKYGDSIKKFLIDIIREELSHSDQSQLHYGDVYDNLITKYAEKLAEE